MPNGDEYLDDLKLSEMIKDWSQPEQFLAKNLFELRKECQRRATCGSFQFSRKQILAGTSGIGGIAVIVNLLLEFARQLVGS